MDLGGIFSLLFVASNTSSTCTQLRRSKFYQCVFHQSFKTRGPIAIPSGNCLATKQPLSVLNVDIGCISGVNDAPSEIIKFSGASFLNALLHFVVRSLCFRPLHF